MVVLRGGDSARFTRFSPLRIYQIFTPAYLGSMRGLRATWLS